MGGEAVRDRPEAVYYTARGRIVVYGNRKQETGRAQVHDD